MHATIYKIAADQNNGCLDNENHLTYLVCGGRERTTNLIYEKSIRVSSDKTHRKKQKNRFRKKEELFAFKQNFAILFQQAHHMFNSKSTFLGSGK